MASVGDGCFIFARSSRYELDCVWALISQSSLLIILVFIILPTDTKTVPACRNKADYGYSSRDVLR